MGWAVDVLKMKATEIALEYSIHTICISFIRHQALRERGRERERERERIRNLVIAELITAFLLLLFSEKKTSVIED